MIAINYSNHGNAHHVQDILEYIYDGLNHINHQTNYDIRYLSFGINIIMENSIDGFYENIVENRKKYPNSRVYLIVTEPIIDNIFNSSGEIIANQTGTDRGARAEHYFDHEKWQKRYDDFIKLVEHIDGLICFSPDHYKMYSPFSKNIFLIPLFVPPKYLRLQEVNNRNTIDILFTGSMTPYRNQIITSLRFLKKEVHFLDTNTPEYIRFDAAKNSNLNLGLKISESSNNFSNLRAFYFLKNRLPNFFEKINTTDPLYRYVTTSQSDGVDNIVFDIYACLESEYNYDKIDEFREISADKYKSTFKDLNDFLINS